MDRTQQAVQVVADASAVLQAGVAAHLETWDQADLGTIERQLQAVLRRVSGALLGTLAARRVAAQASERPACARCGGTLRLVETARPRFVQGLAGDVQVRRPYYHCAAGRQGCAPLDAAWGLGSGTLSPELMRVACRDGIEGAFAVGADLLFEHLGVRVDVEAVRRATETVGAVAEADQQDRTQWAVPPDQVPTTLLLALDGVLVHERAVWRECKLLRVAPLGPALVVDTQTGESHLALGPSSYAAGIESADACWQRAMREAWRRGWGRGVRTIVVLGDGAEWIWRQARCHLSALGCEVVEILDFYHVTQHLGTVAAAVFGAGSGQATAWLDQQRHTLRHQGPAPVRRALAKLRPLTAAAGDEVRKARGYFRTHAHRMTYPAFRARHFPIGSGVIESTTKNLIQLRQTQAGMRWSLPGAQAVASLRALHRSGRWTPFWQSRPQCRLQVLPPPALPLAASPGPTAPALTPVPPAADPLPAPPPICPDPLPAPLLPAPAPLPAPEEPAPRSRKPWEKGKDFWRRQSLFQRRSA
jgi:hypothetical protein